MSFFVFSLCLCPNQYLVVWLEACQTIKLSSVAPPFCQLQTFAHHSSCLLTLVELELLLFCYRKIPSALVTQFPPAWCEYNTTEREARAALWAFQHFKIFNTTVINSLYRPQHQLCLLPGIFSERVVTTSLGLSGRWWSNPECFVDLFPTTPLEGWCHPTSTRMPW